jgi:hypothetical protein
MAGRKKSRGFDDRLAALRGLDVAAPGAPDELRDALRSRNGILVALAARLVAQHHLEALVPELAPAFESLCGDEAAKRDPTCRGKIAIARALHAHDHWDDRVFVAGLAIVQLEGFAREDTAAELRGVCGLAHAHFARANALDVLADLLADRERAARVAAAEGLGDAGRPDAAALLRYKLRLGDPEPEVLMACFDSLLALAGDGAHDFAIGMLVEADERAESAAMALGGARVARAHEALAAWSDRALPEQRHRIGFLALALLRHEPATEYLIRMIRERPRDAVAAARALATFKDDAVVAARIREAAAALDREERREIDALLA